MYVGAGQDRRETLAGAAEGVTAPLDADNPLYETVVAAAVLILSLVMLRAVFPRRLAYLGVATAVAEVVGPELVSSVSPPTALSLPWGLEDYVAALSKAARAAGA